VQAFQEQAPEDFHDGGWIGRGKRQELSLPSENAVRNQGVGVRIEVAPVAAEGLQRDDTAGADVSAVKEIIYHAFPASFLNGRLFLDLLLLTLFRIISVSLVSPFFGYSRCPPGVHRRLSPFRYRMLNEQISSSLLLIFERWASVAGFQVLTSVITLGYR
jgi:hypothetical protein